MALTEDAKAEIAAAIAIVREDRFEKFARERVAKHLPEPPAKDPLIVPDPIVIPPKDPITPPPAKDPKEPVIEPPKAKSRYWGEILND